MSKNLHLEMMEAENAPQRINYSQIELYLSKLCEGVDEGEVDAIVTLSKISKLEKLVKEAKAQVYEQALQVAEEYPEKTFEYKGLVIEKRSGRKVYDFKQIPTWNDLNTRLKDFEKKCKGAYDAWLKGTFLVDEETGEQVPLPGVKNTKDVLVIKSV